MKHSTNFVDFFDRPFPEWAYKAKIAGYAVEPDEGDKEIDEANVGFSYFWEVLEIGFFSEFIRDPELGSDRSLEIIL